MHVHRPDLSKRNVTDCMYLFDTFTKSSILFAPEICCIIVGSVSDDEFAHPKDSSKQP